MSRVLHRVQKVQSGMVCGLQCGRSQVTVMGWPRAGGGAGLRQGLMNEMGLNPEFDEKGKANHNGLGGHLDEVGWHPEEKRGDSGRKRKRGRRRKRKEEQGRGNQLVFLLKYTLSCMSLFTASYQYI